MVKFYGKCEVPEKVHWILAQLKKGHKVSRQTASQELVIMPRQLPIIKKHLRQYAAVTEAWFWATFGKSKKVI